MPYIPLSACDSQYEIGVDYVYVPFTRVNGNLTELNRLLELFIPFVDGLSVECRSIVLHGSCYYYLPPCGNSTHFVPPPAPCHDDCVAAQTQVCPDEYNSLKSLANIAAIDVEVLGTNIVNCSDPGEFINPLPHCCYTAIGTLCNVDMK